MSAQAALASFVPASAHWPSLARESGIRICGALCTALPSRICVTSKTTAHTRPLVSHAAAKASFSWAFFWAFPYRVFNAPRPVCKSARQSILRDDGKKKIKIQTPTSI
ncbi:hypothetical protein DFH06DRAFT_1144014 [Mycena polygramma]|nr:hypothetical protein DFH06DRAFT_1144014 [Mycena polygramma]